MVLNVLQVFTEFIEVPKKECLHYTPPPQTIEATQVEVEVPKVVPTERRPYNEPLPFPMTAARHIRAQLFAEQKEEEVRDVRASDLKISNEEPTHEIANGESEVTKKGILAMYANYNVVELDFEASQFIEGMVNAKKCGRACFTLHFWWILLLWPL